MEKKEMLKKEDIKKKYPVNHFFIFGSYARDEQTENSDIDIMVELEKPIGFKFVHLAMDLEALFNKKVDLVSVNGIDI
jgi:predicted nucleotidyltransferase